MRVLCGWLFPQVSISGSQIVVGFQDGVVRILELFDPKGLTVFAGRKKLSDAELHLKYVFKPHTEVVTALAYERDGEVLATGVSVRFPLISHCNSVPSFPLKCTYTIVPYLPKLTYILFSYFFSAVSIWYLRTVL